MTSGRGVLDTSTVILLGRLTDPTMLPDEPAITTITLAELSVGPLVAQDENEREVRLAHLQQAGFPTSMLSRSTQPRPGRSAGLRHRFAEPAANPLRGPTMR